jgi:hypothetical protein
MGAREYGSQSSLLVAGTVETMTVVVTGEEVGDIMGLEMLLQKAQLGNPVHEIVINWLKPFSGVMVTVVVAVCPLVMVAEAGPADIVKFRTINWLPWGTANLEMNPPVPVV